jgi:tetratricopeptide (TPR) repeat protein
VFQTSQLFLALAELRRGYKDEARAIVAGVRGQMLNGKSPYPDLLREMEAEIFGARAEEARAALEKLLGEHQTGAQALAVLATESSLAEFRSTATNLLAFIESERVVRNLKSEVGLKSRIIERVNSLPDLSPDARALALLMSKEIEENPQELNMTSWATVSKPGREQAEYELALAQAEVAYRLKPDPEILNTVGVAQYRAGKFKQAIETLERSRKANPNGPDTPSDLAFLAMAQYRAGQVDDSRRQLNKLRDAVKAAAGDEEANAFLGEAEKLVGAVTLKKR